MACVACLTSKDVLPKTVTHEMLTRPHFYMSEFDGYA